MLRSFLSPVYTEQEKAISDGRIGSDIVKVDQNGRCGNMDISENLEEVYKLSLSLSASVICEMAII